MTPPDDAPLSLRLLALVGTGGTRASTTDAGTIPAGAVVERVT